MFMEIRSWVVVGEDLEPPHPNANISSRSEFVRLNVSDPDLDSVFKTLRSNGYKKISMRMNPSLADQALKQSEQLRGGK